MADNYEDGVWRTISGRRVFIRKGEDLASAMKRSGKFDTFKRKGYTNKEYQEQENRIAQLTKERNALLNEEIEWQKDWDMTEDPSPELEMTAWDREQKEEELREAREKYSEMSKNPYIERKIKIGKENYEKIIKSKNHTTDDEFRDYMTRGNESKETIENIRNAKNKYSDRVIKQYKEKEEQETYTKTGNIRYNAFGIERTPEGDFSDDGTRFTAYRLPNGMEMTVAKDSDDIYMSVRNPYNKEVSYEEYSSLPGYKELDMYNGVRKNSVNLNEVIKNSNTYMNAYNELLKKKGIKPDTRTNKQIRIDSIKERIESNNRNIEWYKNNKDYSRWRYNQSRINQLSKQNEKLRKELGKIS